MLAQIAGNSKPRKDNGKSFDYGLVILYISFDYFTSVTDMLNKGGNHRALPFNKFYHLKTEPQLLVNEAVATR